MPQHPPEKIYAAARVLLPDLDPARQSEVKALLEQAERGTQTHLQLLDLLTRDDATRQQMRLLLKAENVSRELLLDEFGPLGGETVSTWPGDVFRCPQCGYRCVIGEADEQPLPCPKHPDVTLEKEGA
jgi:rubrerythrin